jgi:GNAT superfamily N-acetyltransferase
VPDPRIRRVVEADIPAVVGLIEELAVYEDLHDEFQLTEDQLRAALFGESPALFGHVAEVDGQVVGYAIWFLSFSTYRGTHGIYLEDVYVQPSMRGSGLGAAMLAALASECVNRGYARFEWWVLDWNQPAIDFYRSMGTTTIDDVTLCRLTGPALVDVAQKW